MKNLALVLATTLLLPATAEAVTLITETFSNTFSAGIVDGDLNGLLQTLTPATSIGSIDQISITLNITGGWNGDFYAYLWHGGVVSVILNRPGRTASDLGGSPGTGLSVIFSDAGVTDVHAAIAAFGSPLSGTYQPDGRNIHPYNALDTTPRTAPLSVFTGAPAAGEYRLFIADVATGETAILTSWSVSITGAAIPEPSGVLLLGLGSLALIRRRR